MGYQRQREKHRTSGRDYPSDSRGQVRRRRSRSRSDSNQHRRRERYHHFDRQAQYRREERHHRTHSRSRSKERRNDDQTKLQEKEQKIRLAIRNNTITYDLAIHEMFTKLPQTKQKELMEQAQSAQKIHECILVRELYVSGLYQAGEQSIRSFFGKYGEIEDVQVIKNFVFVKYFKVQDASNACADYHNINTTLHQTHNNNFKIFFADHLKRFNVVSNNPLYEIKEHLIPVLYASVRNDPQFTNQQYLNSLFSRFGFVRNLEVKRNELPTQRTYVLVEYETLAQAIRAREKMKLQREKLGDRKSEITILIDNDKITRLYPNINNQLRYQRKRQQNTAGQSGQAQSNPNTNTLPPPIDSFSYNNYQSQQKNEVDQIWDILNSHAGQGKKQDMDDENLQSDWCGFFTRNKQFKVEVDFHCIHKEPVQLQTVLNVAYRGDISEALSRSDYIFAGRFRAANSANLQAFQQYVHYFSKKEKAGIVITTRYLIYLIPPLGHFNLPYAVQQNELLALFFKLP